MHTRRHFLKTLAATSLASALPLRAATPPLKLKYLLASALYGTMGLDIVLRELAATGCTGLDLWCKPHGTQREQAEAMGIDAFADLLKKHSVKPVCFTQYPLGPFALGKELPVLKQLGSALMVTAAKGPKNVVGAEARAGISAFLEQMKPHADAAAEHGITIAIENHAGSLLHTPDSIRCWAELNKHPALGMAFAPHHLHEHVDDMPNLIRDLGAANLPFIYFQEYGIGSKQKVTKEVELQQLPGRGTLDCRPILRALRDVGFHGWAEIFMHPTPRGVPILPTASEITTAISQSRTHIEKLLAEVNA
jgi:sugar phosphate isomerase/epimerase